MVSTVDQGCLHAHHRVASEDTELHSVLDTSVDRGDVLARNAATGDLVLEQVQLFAVQGQGLEGDLHLCELTGTTGLLLVGVVDLLDCLLDGLAVSNLRLTNVSLNLELTLHTVNGDVQVQLTHTTNFGLTGFFVQRNGEGGVLSGKLLDSGGQLFLVTLALGLDSHEDHGLREGHRFENNRVCRVAQGVTSGGVLQADCRVNVTCGDLLNRVLLVGVHLEELTDALLLTLGGVQNLLALSCGTGVHAGVGQLTVEGMSCDLECQCCEGLLSGCLTGQLLFLVGGVGADNVRNVQRGGQVIDHSVQHGLNTAVLECRTTENGECLACDHELTDTSLNLGDGQLALFEVLLHELFAGLGDSLNQLGAVLFSLLNQVSGDVLNLVGGTHGHVTLGVAGPYVCLHFEQVNDTDEVALSTDGELNNQRASAQAVNDGLNGEVEVRTHLVHLVDEADTGDVVLVSLTPNGLRLGLNTFLAVEHSNSAVEDAQGALNLNGEVDVTGGVDDVDLVVLPEAGGCCGGNGNTSLLLLSHPVHSGSAVVGLTDLVVNTGVEQNALSGGGLTGVDVRHNTDVADLVKVGEHVKCHVILPK